MTPRKDYLKDNSGDFRHDRKKKEINEAKNSRRYFSFLESEKVLNNIL